MTSRAKDNVTILSMVGGWPQAAPPILVICLLASATFFFFLGSLQAKIPKEPCQVSLAGFGPGFHA